MDLTSYLLGKNSSGGGGGSQEFVINYSDQFEPGYQSLIEQIDEVTLNSDSLEALFGNYIGKRIPKLIPTTSPAERGALAMFQYASEVKVVDLSNIVCKITDGRYMFNGATGIAVLDISGFDLTGLNSTYTGNMFANCGTASKVSDGAYAQGIPYVYVKDQANQNWVLSYYNSRPNSWTTANVVIKE